MQPHYPFIGPTGRQFSYTGYEDSLGSKTKFWHRYGFEKGDATDDELWQAYHENVDIVFDSFQELLRDVESKIVVTADHGSLIGQRAGVIPVKRYGHPPGFHLDELVTVACHELPANTRRSITAEPPESVTQPDESVAREQLVELGYAEESLEDRQCK